MERHGDNILITTLSSMAIGALLGLFVYPSWQVLVISAKYSAGIVDTNTPSLYQYLFLMTWSFFNDMGAILLRAGMNPKILSLLISSVQCSVLFGGLTLILSAITRKPLISVCVPPIFMFFGFYHGRIVYPTFLHGYHTFGVLGLTVSIFILGLFCHSYFRTSAFLAGLMGGVHPSWGVWISLTFGVFFLFNLRQFKNKLSLVLCWSAGAAVTLVSYYLATKPVDLIALSEKLRIVGVTDHQYYHALMQNFAGHRAVGIKNYLNADFFVIIGGVVLNFIIIFRKNLNAGAGLKLFAKFQLSFFFVTFFITLPVNLFPDSVPLFLHQLMVNRFWCLSSLLVFLFILVAGLCDFKLLFGNFFLAIASGLLFFSAGLRFFTPYYIKNPLCVGLIFALIILALQKDSILSYKWEQYLNKLIYFTIYGLMFFVLLQIPIAIYRQKSMSFDFTPTPALLHLEKIGGQTAVAPDINIAFQLYTNIPVTYTYLGDDIGYFKEILPYVDEYKRDIEGEGFYKPYLENRPALKAKDILEVWKKRSRKEWAAIMKRQKITNIITNSKDTLDLPVLEDDGTYCVYRF